MSIEFYGEISEQVQEKIATYIEDTMDGSDYSVMDENAREDKVREHIKESLWAFNAEFILAHSSIDNKHDKNLIKAIRDMQKQLNEGANPIIGCIIKDLNEFAEDAVEADGYGHFLSSYDGEECEIEVDGEQYFLYRQ